VSGRTPPCRKERDEDGAPCVRMKNMEASQTRPSVAVALSGQAPWFARLAWVPFDSPSLTLGVRSGQALRSQKAANSG
jgi:hypothetical protein